MGALVQAINIALHTTIERKTQFSRNSAMRIAQLTESNLT
jgi:hypothetical protein